MPKALSLEDEFEAIMSADRGSSIPDRPAKLRPSNAKGSVDVRFAAQSNRGYGPSRIHPRNERVSPQPSTQAVSFTLSLVSSPLSDVDPSNTR